MKWAWGQYREHAWGKDDFLPVSGASKSFPLKGHHLGLSPIEAMDTLWVMGLDAEFADAPAWVKANAEFAVDGEVSVFETDIRLVGGLLSAHHACGAPVASAPPSDSFHEYCWDGWQLPIRCVPNSPMRHLTTGCSMAARNGVNSAARITST